MAANIIAKKEVARRYRTSEIGVRMATVAVEVGHESGCCGVIQCTLNIKDTGDDVNKYFTLLIDTLRNY